MGNFINSRKVSKHVMICGLEQSGKTTLFKMLTQTQPKDKIDPVYKALSGEELTTFGFNFEYSDKDQANSIGFWDLGGKDTIRAIWSSFYKNIRIGGLIFVVNTRDDDNRINEARMELQKLMNEEELRNAVLYVIFNDKAKINEGDDKDENNEDDDGARKNVKHLNFDGFNEILVRCLKRELGLMLYIQVLLNSRFWLI